MKLNFKDFIRKCQFPVMMVAGSAPLPLFVCAQVMPDEMPACLLLAAVYIAAAWLCTALPGKVRIPAGILLSAGIGALSVAVLPVMKGIAVCLVPLMYIILLLGGLRMGGWGPDQELHPMVGSICLVVHMVAQFLVNVDRKNQEIPMYGAISTPMIICFLIFAALWMLAMNRGSLASAVNGRSSVPRSMRLKNRLLTAGMMAVVLLVAALPAVIRAVGRVWEWIKAFLLMVLRLILSILPEQSSGGGGGGGMDMSMFGGDVREQSLLGMIVEKIVLALALIIAAVLLALALRVVWKKLKILIAKLMERLNAYMISSSEDYVDEISDTRDDAEHDHMLRRARKRMLKKRVDESTLSPRERIRYRYLQMWLRHPDWTPERTARENLNADAANLYERARYSSHEVTEREADAFAQQSERRKG